MHLGPFQDNPTFLILLAISVIFKLFPPKKSNLWYGYRTPRAKLNQRNWEVAQAYSAQLLLGLLFSW